MTTLIIAALAVGIATAVRLNRKLSRVETSKSERRAKILALSMFSSMISGLAVVVVAK